MTVYAQRLEVALPCRSLRVFNFYPFWAGTAVDRT